MTQLEYLEVELMMFRHYLQEYRNYVSPADIADGYLLPSAIKKRINELEARRRELLREARKTSV